MKQTIVAVGIVGLVLGAGVGSQVNKYFMRQHEHTTAVMVLLQFHQKIFEQAVQNRDCTKVDNEARRLQQLAEEIPTALPLADAQDAEFHHRVSQLQQAVRLPATHSSQCAFDMAAAKSIQQACTDCHHDYR